MSYEDTRKPLQKPAINYNMATAAPRTAIATPPALATVVAAAPLLPEDVETAPAVPLAPVLLATARVLNDEATLDAAAPALEAALERAPAADVAAAPPWLTTELAMEMSALSTLL